LQHTHTHFKSHKTSKGCNISYLLAALVPNSKNVILEPIIANHDEYCPKYSDNSSITPVAVGA